MLSAPLRAHRVAVEGDLDRRCAHRGVRVKVHTERARFEDHRGQLRRDAGRRVQRGRLERGQQRRVGDRVVVQLQRLQRLLWRKEPF